MQPQDDRGARVVNLRLELILSAFLLLAAAWVLIGSFNWPFNARIFPQITGGPFLLFAAHRTWQVSVTLMAAQRGLQDKAPAPDGDREAGPGTLRLADFKEDQEEVELLPLFHPLGPAAGGAWMLVFLGAVWVLGFKVGGPIIAFVFLRFGSDERWAVSLLLPLGIALFWAFVLDATLHLASFDGLVFRNLGISSPDEYLMEWVRRR